MRWSRSSKREKKKASNAKAIVVAADVEAIALECRCSRALKGAIIGINPQQKTVEVVDSVHHRGTSKLRRLGFAQRPKVRLRLNEDRPSSLGYQHCAKGGLLVNTLAVERV